MGNNKQNQEVCNRFFIGIDIHMQSWHITILGGGVELFSGSIPGNWRSLRLLLDRYRSHWKGRSNLKFVYEAGYFGFNLYDRLTDWGGECIVTPPSKILRETGNRVKTDRLDSRKLAYLLSKGMLKEVWVPSREQRGHRKVARRRRQLIGDRVRTQNRIKADLRFFGVELPEPKGRWSKTYVLNLRRLKFEDRWHQESFSRLLDEYEFLSEQVKRQTVLLKELSETEYYRKQVKIIRRIHGFGLITTMELLLEIGDFSRFRKSTQLSSYVGLTPSQYSSGDKVRMGRITRLGKGSLRGALVEASWQAIAKDKELREVYDRLKVRAGGKRAIVAVARRLILRCRRMLLDEQACQTAVA
jgi:transposase